MLISKTHNHAISFYIQKSNTLDDKNKDWILSASSQLQVEVPSLRLFNLSYLIFNYKYIDEKGFVAFYDSYDLFIIYKALYKNAKAYAWTKYPLSAFGLLASLGYYTRNRTIISEAEHLWNYMKNENLIYLNPILIKSNSNYVFYRVPYLARVSHNDNSSNIFSQVIGLYHLWKATGNDSYFEDLRKTIYFKESYVKDGVNYIYFYGYYYNVIWHPLVNTSDKECYHPPYGTPIVYIYWDGSAIKRYNYWTWASKIITVFYIAVREEIIPVQLYAKIFRDFFMVLWDGEKTIWEAWHPLTNKTDSLFGKGSTRIHAYNLASFIFASYYYPELSDYLAKIFNVMLKYWVKTRKMYRYYPETTITFEQYMMTIPNFLYQLDNSSEKVIQRNILAALTYLIVGVLDKPVAWPNKVNYYGILHAKSVNGEWIESNSGAPKYVSVKITHEGYATAMYLLTIYGLEQLYFNQFLYSLINCLKKFINSQGYFMGKYTLGSGLSPIALNYDLIQLCSYFPMFYKISYGKRWHDEFRYNYRWFLFPIFFQERRINNETEIIFSVLDLYLNKDSLVFLPFYRSIDEKMPYFNAKKIYVNGMDYTDKAIIFSDNVIAPIRSTDHDNYYVSNLTIVYSNNPNYIIDSDGDLLTDYWENLTGLDPFNIDSDGDGIIDSYEAFYGNLNDYNVDLDRDHMPVKYEQFYFTSPYLADTDGDNLTDGLEIAFNINPLDVDSDNDGVQDGDELKWQLNPRTRYTHSEKYSNRSDWYWYAIREELGSWSRDLEISYEESLDFDNDGINNYLEFYNGYDIFVPDYIYVGFVYPSNNTWINMSTIEIQWIYVNTSNFLGFSIQLDQSEVQFIGFNTSFTATNLNEGRHYFRLYVHFFENFTSIETLYFEVDLTPPVIKIRYPANNSIINKTWVLIEWICYDTLSGIAQRLIKINNDSWINLGSENPFNATGLLPNKNRIEIKISDKAGNVNEITLVIIVVLPKTVKNHLMHFSINASMMLIVAMLYLVLNKEERDRYTV